MTKSEHHHPSVASIVLRSLLVRLAFAGALVVSVSSLAAAADAPAGAPPAPKVTVAAVEEKLLSDYEEITGHVEAIETVELRARVSGHLDAVNFQAGQIVNKGDLLFTID